MYENKYGVHRTHCCVLHGCKYGKEDCPVTSGQIPQDYICLDCEEQGIKSIDHLKKEIDRINNEISCYGDIDRKSDLDILETWVNIQLTKSIDPWIHSHDLINTINAIRNRKK